MPPADSRCKGMCACEEGGERKDWGVGVGKVQEEGLPATTNSQHQQSCRKKHH